MYYINQLVRLALILVSIAFMEICMWGVVLSTTLLVAGEFGGEYTMAMSAASFFAYAFFVYILLRKIREAREQELARRARRKLRTTRLRLVRPQ